MAATFKVYQDSSLTTELTTLAKNFSSDGSTGYLDTVVYIGSTVASKKLQKASNPGVDQIVVSVVDSNGATGQLATNVKLASSSGGLAGATGGASLNIGTQILSGSVNAYPLWIRIQPSNLTEGNYTDLSVKLIGLVELAA